MNAIIFDMDGVISDTQTVCAEMESQTLKEFGIHLSSQEITRRFAGVPSHDWVSQVVQENGKEVYEAKAILERRAELVNKHVTKDIREIPGSVKLVRELKKRSIPLAIGSASPRKFINLVLSSLQISDCFEAIVSADDVTKGKPDPMTFLSAAGKLGILPAYCTVIEDAINGMVAARAAGMRCIGLVSNPDQRIYPADFLVRSHAEITPEMLNII